MSAKVPATTSNNLEHERLIVLSEDTLSLEGLVPRKAFIASRAITLPAWLLVVAIILSSIMAIVISVTLPQANRRSTPSRQIPDLDLPPLGNVQWPLEANGDFWSLNATATHDAWMKLFPKGDGYVDLSHMDNLPSYVREMSSDGSRRYCVAAFHQLHCLHLIYQDYSAALHGEPFKDREHTQHCIEYLRQTIMCTADTNLEPFRSRWESPDHGNKIDGFGSNHMCRDFEQVFQWADKYGYEESPGF